MAQGAGDNIDGAAMGDAADETTARPGEAWSIASTGWPRQVSAAFALMTAIPFLTFTYLLIAHIHPGILAEYSIPIVVAANVLLAMCGLTMLRTSVAALARLRHNLVRVAAGDLSPVETIGEGAEAAAWTMSVSAIAEQLRRDRDRLEAESRSLEATVAERTAELRRLNERLRRELDQRATAEQALRESNRQLSDALADIKRVQGEMIQHERLSALGQMASGIAHDFNNALMPVVGLSEFLLKHPEALGERDDVVAALEDIRSAGLDARQVVQRLREFYKVSDEGELGVVDVNDVVRKCVALTRPRWQEEMRGKGITIAIEEALQDVPLIRGNESQLREALTNLILNAIDAMPEGGTVSLSTTSEDGYVAVGIRDTGTGMDEETRRRCLEPFFSTKGGYGTGIGLPMVSGIVQRHDGTMEVESEEGSGTCVVIRLPVAEGVAWDAAPAKGDAKLRSLRILVIEDDSRSSSTLAHYLAADGHSAEFAAGGQEGVRCFCEGQFDVVITDKALPDVSGDRVAKAVKQRDPTMPVVMLTGFGDLMNARTEHPDGVDVVLGKPTTPQELADAIARAMAHVRVQEDRDA